MSGGPFTIPPKYATDPFAKMVSDAQVPLSARRIMEAEAMKALTQTAQTVKPPAKKVYLLELERIENGWVGTVMPPQGGERKVFGADIGETLDNAKPVIADSILGALEEGQ